MPLISTFARAAACVVSHSLVGWLGRTGGLPPRSRRSREFGSRNCGGLSEVRPTVLTLRDRLVLFGQAVRAMTGRIESNWAQAPDLYWHTR